MATVAGSVVVIVGDGDMTDILSTWGSPQNAAYAVIDIETGNAPQEYIEKALNAWKPPSNIKDKDKIEAKRIEVFDKIAERGALLDASPILCVCIKTDTKGFVFTGMGGNYSVDDWKVIHSENEKDMLIVLRDWLNAETDESTELVGHNLCGFDLPKLRNAYIRNRLLMPFAFGINSNPTVDTMKVFKSFSMESRDDYYPSLDRVADSLLLPRPKMVISGKDVPKYYEQGKIQEILTYCCVDVSTTETAYLLMSGQSTILE